MIKVPKLLYLLLLLLTSCNGAYAAMYPQPIKATTTPSVTIIPSATPTATTASPTPLPAYVVNVHGLEIRSGPSEAIANVGYLASGERVIVYATAQAKHEYCSTWARISPAAKDTRWVCFEYLTGE